MPAQTNWQSIGRWIHLPAAGGANDRFRADQPLSSGTMQIAASNAYIAAYENNLRTLGEHPGQIDIAGTLGFGLWDGAGTDISEFPWDDDPSSGSSVFTWFAGVHRIRQTPDGLWPRIRLSASLSSAGGFAGLILVGRPRMGRPQPGDLYDLTTRTNATPATVNCTISPTSSNIGVRDIAPRDERTVPSPPPAESGRDTVIVLYVGAYTSGAGKAVVRGLSLWMTDP